MTGRRYSRPEATTLTDSPEVALLRLAELITSPGHGALRGHVRALARAALEMEAGNITYAAQRLGVDRRTFYSYTRKEA